MEYFRVRSRAGLGVAALFAATVLSGAAKADADLSGIYWATEYHPKIVLVGGGELPFTAAGKAAYEKNMAGLKDGSIVDNARKFCVPDGLPRVLANPYPFEIVHGPPGQTTIMYELSHQVRAIAMNKPLVEEDLVAFPAYNGHSAGHFEGDVLGLDGGEGHDFVAGFQRFDGLGVGGHFGLEQVAGAGDALDVVGVGVGGDQHFAR